MRKTEFTSALIMIFYHKMNLNKYYFLQNKFRYLPVITSNTTNFNCLHVNYF